MVCAFQCAPQVNIRYEESLNMLAQAELLCLMRAVGLTGTPELNLIGGLPFFQFECDQLTEDQLRVLSRHSALLLLSERKGDLLSPLPKASHDYLPKDLPEILKYKGKTSVPFTRMMINMALCLAGEPTGRVPLVLDPLCGKGTTLFCAMQWGMNAAGVETDRNALKEAMDYLNRYFQFHRLKYTLKQGSVTVGKTGISDARYEFADSRERFSAGDLRRLSIYASDTALAGSLLRKNPADVLVADLPYGIQHAPQNGKAPEGFEQLLKRALPGWAAALRKGGAMALSFNTLTLKKDKLISLVSAAGLTCMTGDPYDHLVHDVEQAVRRDVLFAVKSK